MGDETTFTTQAMNDKDRGENSRSNKDTGRSPFNVHDPESQKTIFGRTTLPSAVQKRNRENNDDESSDQNQKEGGLELLSVASIMQQQYPIESVSKPTDKDVLCGRGGLVNNHSGNIVFRRIVDYNKTIFKDINKRHRVFLAQSIVTTIVNYGGRFLTRNHESKWKTTPFRYAVKKTLQALREKDKEDHILLESEQYTQYVTEGDIIVEGHDRSMSLETASAIEKI